MFKIEMIFKHRSRAITLYLFDEIYPFTIPNYSSEISNLIQSLMKIGQELLKIESRNEWMDRCNYKRDILRFRMVSGHYN